jgi:hypothetical protein
MKAPFLLLRPRFAALLLLGALGIGPWMTQAQWAIQTVTLRPGWNAVFVEVQPEPRECGTVFAGLPVESVWRFNRRQTAVQFIDDPSQLVVSQPDWLVWLPPGHELARENQLYAIEGGRPYLIKLAPAAPVTAWTVKGAPVLRPPEWSAGAFNFVGFPVPPSSPSTFQAFLASARGLANDAIYRLPGDGVWTRVVSPGTTPMRAGEAFWIKSADLPEFSGPLQIATDRRAGLDFGRTLTEQTLRVRNPSTSQVQTVTIRLLDSESVPANAGLPVRAGGVPMSWWQNDFAGEKVGWTNLESGLVYSNLPPGGVWELRLAVRRSDMPRFVLPAGASSATYQSLLEITDAGHLTRLLVPVSAEGMDGWVSRSAVLAQSSAPLAPHAGLWVGTVTVTNVSQPASANPLTPVPTDSAFEFRLLVHVNSAGQASLLQRVLLVWRPGQTNSSGGVAIPGRYVLATDERIAAAYQGSTLRDGKLVGRRFSTAAFSFAGPIPLDSIGAFGVPDATLRVAVTNLYNSPLNPFVHPFHPDHNNLDDRGFSLPVKTDRPDAGPYTTESWTINRLLEMTFTTDPPDKLPIAGWGDTQLGGCYRETLKGLHAQDLVVQGYFRLQQASRVPVLNDGQ